MSQDQKSNPQFIRVRSEHEYEFFTFRKEILYDKRLTGNALKLLLIILDYGKRPNWQLYQNHLIVASGMAYTKFSAAMKCLEKSFYVRRSRKRVKGRYDPYNYEFCSFPILTPDFQNISPVQVFQTGETKLENPNLNYSSKNNVLEETTNNSEEKEQMVSGSAEKLKELEEIKNISPSQKKTLYKKFTHERILSALKAIDISKADSPFALLYKAIEKNYQPNENKTKNQESHEVYGKAEKFIQINNFKISLGIDDKFAYIYLGTASTAFALDDADFKEKFTKSINESIKK